MPYRRDRGRTQPAKASPKPADERSEESRRASAVRAAQPLFRRARLVTVGVVDAARALADLVEISPQIEAAVVVAGDGETTGSVGVPDGRATVLGRAARELLDRAAEFRHGDGRVTQLHAALADGGVFAVTDADDRTIVAVTSGRPAPGLVFYDLKSCLGRLADEGLSNAT